MPINSNPTFKIGHGRVRADIGAIDSSQAIGIQSDEKILVARSIQSDLKIVS